MSQFSDFQDKIGKICGQTHKKKVVTAMGLRQEPRRERSPKKGLLVRKCLCWFLYACILHRCMHFNATDMFHVCLLKFKTINSEFGDTIPFHPDRRFSPLSLFCSLPHLRPWILLLLRKIETFIVYLLFLSCLPPHLRPWKVLWILKPTFSTTFESNIRIMIYGC